VLINMSDSRIVLDESLVPSGARLLLASDIPDPSSAAPEVVSADQAIVLSV
jgi:hypothetical protein